MKPTFPPKADFEERARVLGKVIFEEIDVPVKRSAPPPISILVEIASVVPKSGKTTQCQLLSSSLRAAMGSGLSVQVLPEPWEHPAVRALKKGEPDALLGRYMSEILANYLDYMQSREFHVGILDRSIVDLLIQEEVFMRMGRISREHRDSVWANLLSAPWAQSHVATFYLFTDIDTALARENDGVSLSRTGSVMNRKYLEVFEEAANSTIDALKTLVPQISVFPVDTTDASTEETNAYITLTLLEHLQKKLKIDRRRTVPYSLSLMRSEVAERGKLQVQIKFASWAVCGPEEAGWTHLEISKQVDFYLIFAGGVHPEIAPGEIIRVREAQGQYFFAFKGAGSENTVQRRPHMNIPIDKQQAEELFVLYSKLAMVTKNPRKLYSKQVSPSVGVGGEMHLFFKIGIPCFIRSFNLKRRTNQPKPFGQAKERRMEMKYGLASGVVFGAVLSGGLTLVYLLRNYVEIGLVLGLLNGIVVAVAWFLGKLLSASIFEKSFDDSKIKSPLLMIIVRGITALLVILGATYCLEALFPTTPHIAPTNFWLLFLGGTLFSFLSVTTLLDWLLRRLRLRKQS